MSCIPAAPPAGCGSHRPHGHGLMLWVWLPRVCLPDSGSGVAGEVGEEAASGEHRAVAGMAQAAWHKLGGLGESGEDRGIAVSHRA